MPISKLGFSIIIIILISYFPFFGHLGDYTIRIWDESRNFINSYEMFLNGNYFYTTFHGNPDFWNTKPVLLNWLQILSFYCFGVNEISFRIPSAIAGLLTLLSLFFFTRRILTYSDTSSLSINIFPFIVILILISSQGYFLYHGVRTGDYDSVLTLFTTLSFITFFFYIQSKNDKLIVLFSIFLFLGVSTKGIAPFLFLPGFFINIIVFKQLKSLLTSKRLYLSLIFLSLAIAGIYLIREYFTPGYLKAVYENELGRRYSQPLEGHNHEYFYYINQFNGWKYKPWLYLTPLSLLSLLFGKNAIQNKLVKFTWIQLLSYLLIISLSSTKLGWYDMPLYPLMAILNGFVIYNIIDFLSQKISNSLKVSPSIISVIFIILIFAYPYQLLSNKIIASNDLPKYKGFYCLEYFLREASNNHRTDLNNNKVLYEGYKAQHFLYLINLEKQGIKLDYININKIMTNDTIILSQESAFIKLTEQCEFDIIEEKNNLKRIKIIATKR